MSIFFLTSSDQILVSIFIPNKPIVFYNELLILVYIFFHYFFEEKSLQFRRNFMALRAFPKPPISLLWFFAKVTQDGVFGRGDMPEDFKKSEKSLKRRNDVITSP